MLSGYVIANNHEAFLARHVGASAFFWAASPALAWVFPSRSFARRAVRRLRYPSNLWVLKLIETDSHYCVAAPYHDRPSWLSL